MNSKLRLSSELFQFIIYAGIRMDSFLKIQHFSLLMTLMSKTNQLTCRDLNQGLHTPSTCYFSLPHSKCVHAHCGAESRLVPVWCFPFFAIMNIWFSSPSPEGSIQMKAKITASTTNYKSSNSSSRSENMQPVSYSLTVVMRMRMC